jgi:hypothetical protein
MGHEEVRVWTGVIRSVTRTGDDGLLWRWFQKK